jgi:hypothetical protein
MKNAKCCSTWLRLTGQCGVGAPEGLADEEDEEGRLGRAAALLDEDLDEEEDEFADFIDDDEGGVPGQRRRRRRASIPGAPPGVSTAALRVRASPPWTWQRCGTTISLTLTKILILTLNKISILTLNKISILPFLNQISNPFCLKVLLLLR